jgi:hypothetical protein
MPTPPVHVIGVAEGHISLLKKSTTVRRAMPGLAVAQNLKIGRRRLSLE